MLSEFYISMLYCLCVIISFVIVGVTRSETYSGNCSSLNEPEVKSFDIRLPELEIPAIQTYYVCQQFKVRFLLNKPCISQKLLISCINLVFTCFWGVQACSSVPEVFEDLISLMLKTEDLKMNFYYR